MAGAGGLIAFALLQAFNQVVVKVTNDGISPVFAAGLRSVLAMIVVLGWVVLFRRKALHGAAQSVGPGLLLGGLFAMEFVLLFVSLDLTSVSRASVVFYTMPVWLALGAHLWLPQERLTRARACGLGLALAGVIWALADPHSRNAGDWRGDALALGASLSWAGIALSLRLTRASDLSAEAQLLWQLVVSALVLPLVGPLLGPVLRAPSAMHWAGLAFQGIVVVGLGFTLWLMLLKRYRASDVASFSFLSPVLAVAMGWAFLDEPVGLSFVGALVLVAAGIGLINRG
ncbi:DMT family transporter [Salipiger aestuarii]|uniref:Drug/metabolite transporter (DMT)-like permease n=1 Tax=Salipiger aestuarii TaxID=568098 RepID=A0A327YJA6_9RHOB|nr:DMT family transporter [Salipiger aestuarii]EIE52262.1 drug/metabolite exporter family protein [Citreicella sp. 357]RAK20286.1 drug/metabolite transporter (DMT)-like permease [Salipiger aestuarii]